MSSIKNNFEFKKILPLAVVVLVMIINFGFGIYNLSRQAPVDEPLWTLDRIPKYWKNIKELDPKGTRISDKPGITTALVSGVGLLKENPEEYDTKSRHYNPQKNIENLFLALRLPLFIFTVLMLPVFYFFISRLLGNLTAMFSVLFIGLSPILLGISRIINPDSLLWIFMPLTILSYFNYIKSKDKRYIYSTGILLGLSLLTKYVSNILIIFFLGLIFLDYFLNNKKIGDASQYVKRSLLDLGKIVIIALVTFTILFPAVWVKPEKLLDATLLSEAFESTWQYFVGLIVLLVADLLILKSKIFERLLSLLVKARRIIGIAIASLFIASIVITIVNVYAKMPWFNFESIVASPKSAYNSNGFLAVFLSGFYSSTFGISIVVVIAILIAAFYIFKKDAFSKISNQVVFCFIIFIMLYYLGSTVNDVATTVRYQIALFPLYFIIAATGISFVISFLIKKYKKDNLIIYTLLILISLTLITTLYKIKPFYFSYASNLLPPQYVLNLKDMGDGNYEAAEYLNILEGAENLYVWTDKRGVCYFFRGHCTSTLDYKRYITSGENNFDYFIATTGKRAQNTRQVLSKMAMKPDYLIRFDKLYTFENPDLQINLGGRESNFVKVIKSDKIDVSYSNKPNKVKNGKNKKREK